MVDHAAIHAQFNRCQAELERLAHLLEPAGGTHADAVRGIISSLDGEQHIYYIDQQE